MAKSPIWASPTITASPLLVTSGAALNAAAVEGTTMGRSCDTPRNTPVDIHVVRNNPPAILRLRTNRTKQIRPKNTPRHTARIPQAMLTFTPTGEVLLIKLSPRVDQNKNMASIVSKIKSQKYNFVVKRVFGFAASITACACEKVHFGGSFFFRLNI